MQRYPRVVVVGAGFGGMQAAQSLAQHGVEVLLIDRNNYHTFVPLLYQVAAAQLEPEQVTFPIRNLLRRSPYRLRFLMAEVEEINLDQKWLRADGDVIPYDYLVLATGSQTKYLGVEGASEYALPLRTLEEAIALRNQILACFEQAAHTSDTELRRQLLTFAIVGGGATGVEVAGAITELVKTAIVRDYPTIDPQEIRILLVQSGDRLLPELPPKLGHYTYKRLWQVGIEIYLDTKVSQVTEGTVHLEDGTTLLAATVIWTAGLEATVPDTSTDLPAKAKGKLAVRSTLQTVDYPEVYAIGDMAYVEQNGKPLAGVAPEALQQGVAVAKNIARQLQGKAPQSFSYFNKGRLAIIGCYSGVGQIGKFALTGFLPWLMWLGVHLVYLPGFRNRLLVLLTWLHSYLLGDRISRRISAPKLYRHSTQSRVRSSTKPAILQASSSSRYHSEEH
ncbi:NAD(P)/FAD-dependent oxidoreductase [Egbenema bharatensis]|uniref:NAD(P)/FAD-dependent oxidoreductase n=1 Tax=Egbenema bharatensis TaxID=3463334 RepID=UPI003A85C1A6